MILCSPMGLDFGLNAVGITSTLSVLCTNIGQNVPGHPEANLFIPDPNSSEPGPDHPERGHWRSSRRSISPSRPTGLAAGQSAKINVTYAPTAGGADLGHPDHLEQRLGEPQDQHHAVRDGEAALPDCDFVLNPANGLAFGHVDKGADAVLPFEVVNNGTDECLVNALQISAGSSSAFSLPDYPGRRGDQRDHRGQLVAGGAGAVRADHPAGELCRHGGLHDFEQVPPAPGRQPDRQQLVGLPPDPAEPAGLRGGGLRSGDQPLVQERQADGHDPEHLRHRRT